MEQQGAALPWAQQPAGEQQGAAALPWARQTAEDQPDLEVVDADLPATLGLSLGDRVEVLWEVTHDETGESTRKVRGLRQQPARASSAERSTLPPPPSRCHCKAVLLLLAVVGRGAL